MNERTVRRVHGDIDARLETVECGLSSSAAASALPALLCARHHTAVVVCKVEVFLVWIKDLSSRQSQMVHVYEFAPCCRNSKEKTEISLELFDYFVELYWLSFGGNLFRE